MEKFSDYVINGPKFEVVTDNNPLTYILTTAKLNTTGLRWIYELANYQFSIIYRRGKKHIDADFLLRNPVDAFEKLKAGAENEVDLENVKLIFTACSKPNDEELIKNVKIGTVELKNDIKCGKRKIAKEELICAREDEIIAPIYKILEGKLKVDRRTRDTLKKESVILLKQYKKLSIEKGVLMRRTKSIAH